MSRHGFNVATWLSCPGGRDLEVMSRPGLGKGWVSLVLRPRAGCLHCLSTVYGHCLDHCSWTLFMKHCS